MFFRNKYKKSFFHMACGILAPQLEIKPAPPALEAWGLNHWTTREVPQKYFFKCLH